MGLSHQFPPNGQPRANATLYLCGNTLADFRRSLSWRTICAFGFCVFRAMSIRILPEGAGSTATRPLRLPRVTRRGGMRCVHWPAHCSFGCGATFFTNQIVGDNCAFHSIYGFDTRPDQLDRSGSTDWFEPWQLGCGYPPAVTDANVDTVTPNATVIGTRAHRP